MAQRRMFSLQIVDTDAFLEMPVSSQLLYFHLAMRADDDGFVANPKKIMRIIGVQEDDYKILIAKRFLLTFESGVVVIKHWKIHNYIQSDRYHETQYVDEKNSLVIKDNGVYTDRVQDVSKVLPEVRLGKDSIGKVNTSTTVEGPSPEVQELWDYGLTLGFIVSKQRINRYAIQRLIKTHGKDLTKKYAQYSQAIRKHQYAPQINNWLDLEDKLLKLRDFAERQKKKSAQVVSIDL